MARHITCLNRLQVIINFNSIQQEQTCTSSGKVPNQKRLKFQTAKFGLVISLWKQFQTMKAPGIQILRSVGIIALRLGQYNCTVFSRRKERY